MGTLATLAALLVGLAFVFWAATAKAALVTFNYQGQVKGTVTDANTGAKLGSVVVMADGESATTNRGGEYTIRNVSEGDRSVTTSKVDYVTQEQPAAVTAGQTKTVNFALVHQ